MSVRDGGLCLPLPRSSEPKGGLELAAVPPPTGLTADADDIFPDSGLRLFYLLCIFF